MKKVVLIVFLITNTTIGCRTDNSNDRKSNLVTVLGIRNVSLKLSLPSVISHRSSFEYSDYGVGVSAYDIYSLNVDSDTAIVKVKRIITGDFSCNIPDSTVLGKMEDRLHQENKSIKILKKEIRTIDNQNIKLIIHNYGFYISGCIQDIPFSIELGNVKNKLTAELILSTVHFESRDL